MLPGVRAELEELVDDANALVDARHAPSTKRAYLSSFVAFEAWCAKRGLAFMPTNPATLALYLTALQKTPIVPRGAGGEGAARPRSCASIERAHAGIVYAHRARGFDWPRSEPTIAKIMASIRRKLGKAPLHQKAPVDDDELALLVATRGEDLVGLRDRALLLLGWLGAFRRSELVALCVADVSRERAGLRILVRSSKTDQESEGEYVGIPFASNPDLCARRALDAWLAAAQITEGPIFRSVTRAGTIRARALCDRAVALVVQRAAARAGLDPAKLAGHSLRAGFATTASLKGKSTSSIARQLRHKSESTTKRYVRPHTVFRDNAAAGLV
jgi:integrase